MAETKKSKFNARQFWCDSINGNTYIFKGNTRTFPINKMLIHGFDYNLNYQAGYYDLEINPNKADGYTSQLKRGIDDRTYTSWIDINNETRAIQVEFDPEYQTLKLKLYNKEEDPSWYNSNFKINRHAGK